MCATATDAPSTMTILERTVNGQPGLVAQQDGVTVTVFAFEVAADRIKHIWAIRTPRETPALDDRLTRGSIPPGPLRAAEVLHQRPATLAGWRQSSPPDQPSALIGPAGPLARTTPMGHETPVPWSGQYPFGFFVLERYCWW